MAPAFHNSRAAAGFAAFLTVLLILPILQNAVGFSDRASLFRGLAPVGGGNTTPEDTIYAGPKKSDVVYLGSSAVYASIKPGDTEKYFSQKLGRPAVVAYLVKEYSGADKQYLMLSDYLDRHTTSLVVLSTPWRQYFIRGPSHNLGTILRFGEFSGVFEDVSLLDKAKIYSEMVLFGPRQLLNYVRPNLRLATDHYDDVEPTLKQGYGEKFAPFSVSIPEDLSNRSLLNVTSPKLVYEGPDRAKYDYVSLFYAKIAALAKKHGARLLLVNFPELPEFENDKVITSIPVDTVFPANQKIFAVTPRGLFGDLPYSTLRHFYRDEVHMNENGAAVFGKAVIPAIYGEYLEAIRGAGK